MFDRKIPSLKVKLSYLFASDVWIWIGSVPLRTNAVITRVSVFADSVRTARSLHSLALVDVTATVWCSRISSILGFARAHVASRSVGTHRMSAAYRFASLTLIHV